MWKSWWKPWQLVTRSNDRAVANARLAATELCRLRLERAEVEPYLDRLPAAPLLTRAASGG